MRQRNSQRGAALLLVLWVVALLSVMAATLLLIVDRSTKTARHLLLRTQAQALADSAFNRTLWALTAADPQRHPPLNGQFHNVEIIGGQAQAAVSDEAGRIDLNTASPELLQSLLQVAGADVLQAEALVRGIADKRSPSSSPTQRGSAPASTWMLGFLDVSDFLALKGMTLPLYEHIKPAITVYTRAPVVDVRYAPDLVKKALTQNADHQKISTPLSDVPEEAQSLAGRVLRLSVRVSTTDGGAVEQTQVVRLTGDSRQPVWMLNRSDGIE